MESLTSLWTRRVRVLLSGELRVRPKHARDIYVAARYPNPTREKQSIGFQLARKGLLLWSASRATASTLSQRPLSPAARPRGAQSHCDRARRRPNAARLRIGLTFDGGEDDGFEDYARTLLIWVVEAYIEVISYWYDPTSNLTSTEGGRMNAPNDNPAAKGLRGWWLSPPRPGMQRLIAPWEYRHVRGFGLTRIAGGSVGAAAGIVCLSYRAYGWAAFFLVIGALNLAGGYWYLTIARSASART